MNFQEIGTTGLTEYSGFIEAAYAAELRWPACQPLYNRLLRSDPEMSMVRLAFGALARGQSIDWEMPDNPSDGDKQAQEFAQQVTDDIDGGCGGFLEKMATRAPFMGWAWWEVLPGLRDPAWRAPGEDDWTSSYDDGRIGIRRMAWRDSTSFYNWDLTENGRLKGMVQQDFPNPSVTIPLDRSLHIAYGDQDNPEGLALLEAVWRLERIKYGLEVVQGIGFEHSAGHVSFTAENGLTQADMPMIRNAARALLSAQEGNYLALPKGFTAEIIDSTFGSAAAILEAIKYFGLLKLMVCNMQWMALSAVTGSGSYAAMNDSSSMAVMTYNAMMDGFAAQFDSQVGRRLFRWNQFPGMTRRPRAVIPHIEKVISLGELGSILGPLAALMPLGEEDYIAIRRRTGFLPETLPETDERPENKPEPEPEAEPEGEDVDDADEDTEDVDDETAKKAEAMAESQAYWTRYLLQHPEAVNG